MDSNYWILYLRLSEVNINRIRVGEEVDIPRHVGGTDTHKLLEENYEEAKIGDKLIIASFSRQTQVICLADIVGKDDKFIRVRKEYDLYDPISHDRFESDSLLSESTFLEQVGTLKKIDENAYNHIIENIIGRDNLDNRE